jgi:GNAT superfamily N-acetyltransferase
MDPVVRPAALDDVMQLIELEREARHALSDQRGGQRWLETHAERADRWSDAVDAGDVSAAVIGEVVVGYLVSGRTGSIARIEEVYVTPEAREVGFGDALIEAAVTAAREANCTAIEGEALPGDRDTKNLYERAGITARLIVVSRPL